jgi:hypothetical protein
MSGTSECGCTVVWRSPKARPSSVTDRALATASQICYGSASEPQLTSYQDVCIVVCLPQLQLYLEDTESCIGSKPVQKSPTIPVGTAPRYPRLRWTHLLCHYIVSAGDRPLD